MVRDNLTQMEADLQHQIESAKENYLEISQLATSFSSNPRKLYTYLNSLSKSKYELNFIKHNDTVIHDPPQRATPFNELNSTFTASDFVLPPTSLLPTPVDPCLSKVTINEVEVYEILAHLDTIKAMGYDNIHPQYCSCFLAAPLTSLFQLSLSSDCIPHEWKIHKIFPIPKGGDKSTVSNYRPISLLSNISKVLEKVVYNKIITFIRPKLSKQQFGFLQGRSYLSQLLLSFAQIFSDLDRGAEGIDAIFLDFRKAFDSVPYNELLVKLWNMGITGKLWSWFREYLSHQQHYVHLDNTSSTLMNVKSGIPQESILGPNTWNLQLNQHKCKHLRLSQTLSSRGNNTM
jgi:hypothetical protein